MGDNRGAEVDAALSQVRAIYTELERRPLERNCQRRGDCCHFRLTGRTPYLTRGEALLALKAFRASGRKFPKETGSESCPLLERSSAKCTIYADRPFGCRTHFCAAAGGPYARKEVSDLIVRLEQIDASLGGDGSRSLRAALQAAAAGG